MRYGLVCVVLGAGLYGACSFKPDYDGTVYTCGLDESCPDGYACIEQRCPCYVAGFDVRRRGCRVCCELLELCTLTVGACYQVAPQPLVAESTTK